MGSNMWTTLVVIGPVLLALILAYAVIANRRRSRRDEQRTEAATHNLYENIDREDKASGRTEP